MVCLFRFLLLATCLTSSAVWAESPWQPSGQLRWDWQLSEPIKLDRTLDVIDLDLFDTDAKTVTQLKARGIRTICYINVGAWENWRPDRHAFPKDILGHDFDGWEGERWLDIRQIDQLAPIIRARFDLCRDKGFDAIEPDNMDAYQNGTGFAISRDDQLRYNRWLAQEAHKRGLSIGLKNTPDLAAELADQFDWALTEECFAESWCGDMQPFLQSGKAVFATEYEDQAINADQFCAHADRLGLSGLIKKHALDAWWRPCLLK
ncbi:endo alpha-1,4 polygalactosaminidase [Aestuariispira insulae]|uniref:Glycoside-hydrolase family GH114 TIM-barrel domain-containing protein n=1 Tax=Aestuariispira insulae TaxID=1461337 RepID=A0A3D9HPW3_9PROT|nr:endo alpha-1,4 polygalactosaminidase [Aestuariispira insulae]RED51445.1 hypothetical protein DFP90_103246 [Aestuariispira insulae]